MAKEGSWSFGIIDDNQNHIVILSNNFGNVVYSPSDVYLQFIKAGYNVTDNMILNFRWLNIDWDYVQLITEDDNSIEGLRLFKRSSYLNAYHIALNSINNDSSLEKHFFCCEWPGHSHPIKYYYKFDVHYVYEGCQYNIMVDIIMFYEDLYSNYTLYDKNGKLYVEYQRRN